MKAAVYVRVSTEEQAQEGYSLDAQNEILTTYCIAEGWDIYSVYREDGFSGTNIKRPEYSRMMSEIDSWDVLLVLKMDRIHRNSRNFMNMMDHLNRKDKMFVSCTESFDTTHALGRFVVDMIQRIAQLESEQIGERTYIGMEEKAKSMVNTEKASRTMGFNPPFGYDLMGGILVSVPEELDLVSEIFDAYSEGDTIDAIAYRLNNSGRLTRKNNPWNKFNLRNILHNPIYAGFMRWDDIMVKHFASTAVTPEKFNKVQELMASRVKDPKKKGVKLVPEDDFE
jgi:DNA invertase Pin-like site-specific DNA recombinase